MTRAALIQNGSAEPDAPEVALDSERSSWNDRMILICGVAVVVIYYTVYGFDMLTRRTGVDENLTGWIVSGSFVDSISRSAAHQGQSPLYFSGLWLWSSVFGSSILTLRLPSVIAHFLAAWQLKLLGESLAGQRAGLIASVVFLGLNPSANDARPYAFLILGLIVAARLAIRWSEGPSAVRGVAWAFAAAFVLYMHPFGIYAVVPQAVFLLHGVRSGARIKDVSIVGIASVVLVLPMVPQLLQLAARQSTLVIVELPTRADYFGQLLPDAVIGALLVALFLALITDRRVPRVPTTLYQPLGFVLLWAVLPSTALFMQSHVSGDSIFVSRYMDGAYPGLALTVGVLFTLLPHRILAIASLAVFAVMLPGQLEPVVSPNWEPAVEIIADSPNALVVTMSGYIELADPEAFPPSEAHNEYFNAPLRWHGVNRPLQSIPRDASATDANFIRETLRPAIDAGQPVVLVDFVWIDRTEGPLLAESMLLSSGYRIDLVDSAVGPHTTRYVFDNQ